MQSRVSFGKGTKHPLKRRENPLTDSVASCLARRDAHDHSSDLRLLKVEGLADREGWYTPKPWHELLSLGEQQSLGT